MKINPIAINFWIFAGLVGYLVDGANGAVWGLTISTGVSLLVESASKR